MPSDIAERFKSDTANHEMTVLRDDGLYKHLRFKAPNTGFYWFDIVTWPGKLAFTGDMDGYVFSRTEDMIDFFRDSSWKGKPNPTYWGEKVIASRDRVMKYDPRLLEEQVTEDLKEAEAHYPGVTEAWNEKVHGLFAEYNLEHEPDARVALNAFEYLPEGEKGEPFRFQDAWEWQVEDYNSSFLWCCHAIVWGIAQYDAAQREPAKATAGTETT